MAESGIEGSQLSMLWAGPFGGLLLSLALLPLIWPTLWHAHYGKISAGWALITIGMTAYTFGLANAWHEILNTYLHHFFPFIIFILSLYVICGGIKVDIAARATPYFNTLFLALATFLASLMGTTGAAMLFIRPFLNINRYRSQRRHLVIFFIFLVCNIGGSLTAIGDPPLFLGFLNGIDFFWPTLHLLGPATTVILPLLCIFYSLDQYYYSRELGSKVSTTEDTERFIVKLEGEKNFFLLAFAIMAIIFSGIWKPSQMLILGSLTLEYPSLLRDSVLLLLTYLSLKITRPSLRQENQFSWGPFMEVFKIFAAIFITAAPVIAMLKAGSQGSFSSLVNLANTAAGPNNILYYWGTGLLSSVLDNAPTYLVFFNLAGGDPATLMGPYGTTLIAISCGAVFMGALTYIGNAPNFMVKAIAEQNQIAMPSFFGYLAWSLTFLLPLFGIVAFIWL